MTCRLAAELREATEGQQAASEELQRVLAQRDAAAADLRELEASYHRVRWPRTWC